MRKGSFSLSKWYLDCITDKGDLVIGYAILFRWKMLKLKYVASITCVNDNIDEQKAIQQSDPFPVMNESKITWNSSKLEIAGEWTRNSIPLYNKLLVSDKGDITWTCHQPSSIVNLSSSKAGSISGFGYVEKLDMSLEPWRLPFEELRWGRFVSGTDNIVWIEWRGKHPKTLIYFNGRKFDKGRICDGLVEVENEFTLELQDSFLLHSGDLLSSLPVVAVIARHLTPLKNFQFNDNKWRSRGTLKINKSRVSCGWVIHEIVRFI